MSFIKHTHGGEMPNEIVELEEDEVEDGQVRLHLLPGEDEAMAQPGYRQFHEQMVEAEVGIVAINSIDLQSAENIHLLSGIFDLPLAHDALKVLGPALLAWIHGRVGRRVEVRGFGVTIKANSVGDAERLLEKLTTLESSQPAAKKPRKKDRDEA
jgi:hypothetical protein